MDRQTDSSPSALKLVLVVALPQEEVRGLLECSPEDEPCALWPSTLYGCLAEQMLTSRWSWERTAQVLDQRFSPWIRRFDCRPAIELAQAARDGRGAWEAQEFAALLWTLIRRRDPALDRTLARLHAEAELAILQLGVRARPAEPVRRRRLPPEGHLPRTVTWTVPAWGSAG